MGINRAKTAEPISCPKNRALDGRVQWRHLANTVKRSCAAAMSESTIRDGDAACFRITIGNVVLTLTLQLGGYYNPPRRTFHPVALKPLRIVIKAFVTFPQYMWAKNAEKMSDISTSFSNMAAGKWIPN